MWETKDISEVEKIFRTNVKYGLTNEEVKERIKKYGKNELVDKKKESFFIKFIKQFNDFMIIILIVASILSAIITKVNGDNDYIDSIVIIVIVVLNALMGVMQEQKAEKSLEVLKNITAPLAKVKREGKIFEVDAKEIVPGDIIMVEAGNYVPADSRLISTSNLKVDESNLTGETLSVLKNEKIVLGEGEPIGDKINMIFASTAIIVGHGEAIVTETGMKTNVGKIAGMIANNKSPQTPIQKKLAGVGKILGIGCLVICAIIFIIGLIKNIEPIEMFMTSVGLAVAAIPEGLPAIVTIVLSIGVTKMAKKNSIIRKLPAVETLGSTNVICSDKTGTLTQNKMQVLEEFTINSSKEELLSYATMCTDCELKIEGGKIKAIGEPTEVAIVNRALDKNINKEKLYEKNKRVADIPFDSNRKMMTTIHRFNDKYLVITKGAPDILLSKCHLYKQNSNEIAMDLNTKKKIEQENEKMADKALRVISVAYKLIDNLPNNLSDVEENLIFMGLIGMMDPPRKNVKEAIATCKRAGIKTVMITGDHITTAKAIAKELGILKMQDIAITGKELDKISQKDLEKNIMNYSVFARVSPEHKVRIVNAFREQGNIVAMTGDGVNDAPALKKADIGIAMGKNGTDVAKNAADMILTDDNFVTIVEAIKQGRNIFDNIRKAIHFLISTNIGEIVTIFVGLLFGIKSPLLALQLLWINLITDSFPAIGLGLEKAEDNLMARKPLDSKKGLFADGLWVKICIEGIMIGILTLFAFNLGNNLYGLEVGRTMAFVSLGMLELAHSFNIKSEESIFKIGIFENKYLVGAFLVGMLLQIGVVIIPPIANIFKLTALNYMQWLYTILISIIPIVVMELQKKFNEFKFGKIIYKKQENTI